MLTKEELPPCPVATTLRLIGNKWKIFVLQYLWDGPHGFGELRASIPGISDNVLSQNLKQLETDGIVKREVVSHDPLRTEYSLTDVGASMHPIVMSMESWGKEYQKLVLDQD